MLGEKKERTIQKITFKFFIVARPSSHSRNGSARSDLYAYFRFVTVLYWVVSDPAMKNTRTHVDAWHQCIMPGPIILICSNIKIMKYNYFFIEIGIYRSRFDTQYIYPNLQVKWLCFPIFQYLKGYVCIT